MSYIVKTEHGQEVVIADGKWIGQMTVEIHDAPPNYPVGRQDPAPEVIGVEKKDCRFYCMARQSYRNGTGCWSEIRVMTVVSHFPFAVLKRNMVGTEFENADIRPARQVHKGELGRYPKLPNLPKVCHQIMGEDGKVREFVQWSEVAAAYGEFDLRKLWRDMLPLARRFDFQATYRETMQTARVHYPRPVTGNKLTHITEEFLSCSSPERVENYITRHADEYGAEKTNRLRTKMKETHARRLADHQDWVCRIRERKTIPGELLWDDPVLQFDHLCVPLSFARSILLAKRFGFVPNVNRAETP